MIGESLVMQHVFNLARKVAKSTAPVLITGESGTGKELLARRIHTLSPQRFGDFIPINCGAIPEDLAESELFGHVRGSFTGAISPRVGKFRSANQGTLFLDEIAELDLRLQVKLLRVVQDGIVEPVGSDAPVHVKVRVISATHQNLWQAVQEGRFREDLYYRLNVLPLELPPLRERDGDIQTLILTFLDQQGQHYNRPAVQLDPVALERCLHYPWPGNVRELENVMERLTVLSETGRVDLDDLPEAIRSGKSYSHEQFSLRLPEQIHLPEHGINLNAYIFTIENELMNQALNITGHNESQAALLLGLNRGAFLARIRRRRLSEGHAVLPVLIH